ncbi:NFAT activation molecule 1 isoform X2 [Fukomys damarensis]|uniref:NFAT activation molecule 1 isoform X2 n=1 Tax=Fukomys damarensis TaxID=885580 RepID=UPI0014551549|nr:NFAT activation molecule 1 isoform X2 [Fukomys damarensis]
MESWFPGWWAPAGPLMAVRLLRLLLVPWTLQLADLQGQQSPKKQTTCHAGPGTENQTYTLTCWVRPRLPDASATGTYYCYVHWQSVRVRGSGTFILVRDTGYQHLPPSSRKTLLYGFTGLLAVLSVLGTALLLWKKKQRLVPRKHPTPSCPDPRSASRPTQPAAESAYMALQHRETEVYAYIESKENSPLPAGSPPSQERRQQFEDDSEVNLVYENL